MKNTRSLSRLSLFWLLNLPFFILVHVSFISYLPFPLNSYGSMGYFIALAVAQAGIISWIFLLVLPWLLGLLSVHRISPIWLSFIAATCVLYLLLLDKFVYFQFRTHINWSIVQMILSPVRAQIFDLSSMDYFGLASVFVAVFILQGLLFRLSATLHVNGSYIAKPARWMLLALLFLVQGMYVWADAVYKPEILMTSELMPWFHGATAKRFLARHHIVTPQKQRAGLGALDSGFLNYPLKPLQIRTLSRKPNILILAIDAWRYDNLNRQTTPNLARLADSSELYLNHFSGGNSTRAGIFSLFYSLAPNTFETFYQAGKGPILFDVLYRQGYEVGVYTSASAISPPFHRTVFSNVAGFEPTLHGSDSVERDKAVTVKLKQFFKQAQKTDKPFFAFAFYDSAHAYHFPPPSDRAPFQPTGKVSILKITDQYQQQLAYNQYRNAVYFIDDLFGALFTYMEKSGLMQNTLIIVTSDHGEEFNDNGLGFWGHNGNFTPAQTRVPLLVHWPEQRTKKRFHHTTTHYDVMPTLLNQVLGVQNPFDEYSLGRLLSDDRQREIILMGSYGNVAIYSPAKSLIAVANRLGYFEMQNQRGEVLKNKRLDPEMLGKAFEQMHRFSGKHKD